MLHLRIPIVFFVMLQFVCLNSSSMLYSEEQTGDSATDVWKFELEKPKAELLYEEIMQLIDSEPAQDRNYTLILEKAKDLVSQYPSSISALSMLHTIERWHVAKEITSEEYEYFHEVFLKQRQEDENARTLFGSIEREFAQLTATNQSKLEFQGIVRSCQDILESQENNQRIKCLTLLWLTRIHFWTKDYEKTESYINDLIQNNKENPFDFLEADMIRSEVTDIKMAMVADQKGTVPAVDVLLQSISQEQDFNKVADTYEKIILLLDSDPNSPLQERKIQLLRDFVNKYPDNNSEQMMRARLTLGYTILNQGSSMAGDMDMPRAKEIAMRYKANAEEAEVVFRDALEICNSDSFKQAILSALDVVEKAKTPRYPQVPENERRGQWSEEENMAMNQSNNSRTRWIAVLLINGVVIRLVP